MARVTYQGGDMEGISSDAASEQTLNELLKAFKAQGGSGGKFNDTAEKAQKQATKATKTGTKATEADTKQTKEHTGTVKDAEKAIATFSKALMKSAGRGILNVGESITGFAGDILGGSHRISELSKHVTGLIGDFPGLGLVGDTAQMFFNILDGQIDTFRQMSGVGADLGDDLFAWTQQSAIARVSLDTLTNVYGEHSKTMALAFGGAREGVNKFTAVLGGVRDLSEDFTKLGYTVEEQAEYTAEYIDLQKRTGMLKNRSDASLIAGTRKYMLELDRLARITGQSRKETADAMKQAADDKRIKALMHNMEANASESLRSTIAILHAQKPELADAFKELVATGGVPITDGAKAMALQNNELSILAKKFFNKEKVTMGTVRDTINLSIDKARAIVEQNGDIIGVSMATGVTGVWDSVLDLLGMEKIKAHDDAIAEQTQAMAASTKDLLEVESNLVKAQTKANKLFIESKIWGEFTDVISEFSKNLKPGGPVEQAMLEGVKTITGSMSQFKDWLLGDGTAKEKISEAWDYTKKIMKGFATKLMGWLGFDVGEEGTPSATYTNAAKKLEDTNKQIIAIQEKIKSGTLNPEQMEKALAELKALRAEAEKYQATMAQETAKGQGKKPEGVGLGAWLKTNWDKVAIGVGAGTLAVGALVAAFYLGPIIVAGVSAIMGILLIGAGVVTLLAGALWLVSDAVGGIAEGLTKLGEVKISPSFKDLPDVMGNLAGPLAALAGAGILSFLGAGGLTKLADNLKAYEQLNVDALTKVGPALTGLYGGISAFTGDGFIEGASKWLGNLFSGNNFEDMADGLKHFDSIDAVQLEKIGVALEGISAFINSMEADNISDIADAIEKLTDAMDVFESKMSDMNSDVKATFSTTVSGMTSSSKGQGEQLSKLNTTLGELITITSEGNRIETKQLEAIKEIGGTVG